MAANSPWAAPLKAFFDSAQSLPGFNSFQQGHNAGYANLPDQGVPLCHQASSYNNQCYQPKLQTTCGVDRRRFSKFRWWVKTIVVTSQVCSGLFSLLMEVAMCYMVYKFYKTKDVSAYGRSSPWARNTKLWPTVMLLASSGITVLLSLAILASLCCLSKNRKAMFSVYYNLIHIGAWVGVSVLYRVGRTEKDLWGWSCSSKAETIQSLYKDELNFSALCNTQVSFDEFGELGMVTRMTRLTS